MTYSTPTDTQVSSDDAQLMYQLGVSRDFIRLLLSDAGLPIPDYLISLDTTDSPELSPTEASILSSGGAPGSHESDSHVSDGEHLMALDLAHECRAMVEQCYDPADVAKLLQISPEATINCASEEASDRYAFRLSDDGPWLFPHWQFYELGPIPGLGHLLSAAGESVNPLVISWFMLMKSTDLENDDELFSPRDWLIRGFEPDLVLMLARDL
jgi:hypothetical protein